MRVPVYEQEVAPSSMPGPQAQPLESGTLAATKLVQAANPLMSYEINAQQMASNNEAMQQSSNVRQLGNLLGQRSTLAVGDNIKPGTGPQGTTPWAVNEGDLSKAGFTDDQISGLRPFLDPSGKTYSTYSSGLLRQASQAAQGGMDADSRSLFMRYTLPTVDELSNQYEKHEVQQVQQIQINTASRFASSATDAATKNAVNPNGTLNTTLLDDGLHAVSTSAKTVSGLLGEPLPAAPAPPPGEPAAPGSGPGVQPPVVAQAGPADEQYPRLAQAQSAYVGELLKSVATSNNTALLQQAYEKYGPYLHGDDALKMKEFVQAKTDYSAADAAVTAIYDPAKSLSDQAAALRTQFKDNPTVAKQALAMLLERDAINSQSEKAASERTTGTLWQGVLAGHGASWVMQQPEYQQGLDGNEQMAFLSKLKTFQSSQSEEPTDPTTIAKRGFLFNDLLAQGRAGTLTQDAVYSNAPGLGKQYTAALVSALGDMAASPQKVQQYKVDDTLLSSALRHAGLQSDKPTPAETSLQGDLSAKIMLRQSASQVPWSQEQTQKMIDSEIQPIVTGSSWFGSPVTKRAFQVEDQVPQAFIQEAQKRNPGMSRNAITQAYFMAKDKGLLGADGTYSGPAPSAPTAAPSAPTSTQAPGRDLTPQEVEAEIRAWQEQQRAKREGTGPAGESGGRKLYRFFDNLIPNPGAGK